MSLDSPRLSASLPPSEQAELGRWLQESHDVTVFVDGTAHRLEQGARDAVVDLLQRLAGGNAVSVASVSELLTTSQAAELAGISHTFLRNMTDRGELAVQYRGTHRRIRSEDVFAWLANQRRNEESPNSEHSASHPPQTKELP